jgi:hypothetical membrane protein
LWGVDQGVLMLAQLFTSKSTFYPTLPAVVYFAAVIVLAHFFAPPGYRWTMNTISDLGSQGHVNKWVMQAGFIGFGLLLAGGLLLNFRRLGRINPPDLLLIVYGLSILVTGFFCTAPINSALPFSASEAQVHSLFAALAGFALVGGMVWYLAISPTRRVFHLIFLVLVIALSGLFGLSENGQFPIEKGILQRALYLVSFIWLVFQGGV